MHATPAGFIFLPGTELSSPGGTTEVFGVRPAAGDRAGPGSGSDGPEPQLLCKRLGSRALDEPWMRERLVAEGRLLGELGGRAAPRLVAAGEDARGPWLVMERLPWPTLASRTGRCEAGWMEGAAPAALEALAAVHAAGVVHGDVSPDNVLVSDDGRGAALVDFGLARGPSMPPLPAGPFRGTLVYAAPEVARGEAFDARADVFALAASLLHAWSGEAPRTQESGPAMLLAAGDEGIDAWAARAARGLSPGLARRLIAACAFDAAARLP